MPGWNPHGRGPFSEHILYGPVSASAGSSVSTGAITCFGAKAIHFIVRSDTAGVAAIAEVRLYGHGASTSEANVYSTHGAQRNFNPNAKNTNLGWVFSITPANFAGSSSDAAGFRRLWFDRAELQLTVSTATLQNLTVYGIAEWEI